MEARPHYPTLLLMYSSAVLLTCIKPKPTGGGGGGVELLEETRFAPRKSDVLSSLKVRSCNPTLE